MNEADLVNVALTLSDQIDFLWNIYITVCAILLGWVFSSKVSWDREKQMVILALFFIFVAMNLLAIVRNYNLLELVLLDLRQHSSVGSHFIPVFSNATGIGSYVGMLIHLIGDFGIYWLIKKRTR